PLRLPGVIFFCISDTLVPTTYLVDTTLSDASDYDQTVHAVRLLLIQRRAILCLKPGNHIRFLLIAAVRIFCTTKRGWQGSHLRGTESP
ncbi:hypothetical protein, partial [Klebsiella quasipneumoniae]|uniref:hypothetical protein n=1 Tax=Klebsiella quasipneumoniae TaxID=1463165 RepID=UPI002157C677